MRKDIKLFLLLLIVFCFMSICCFSCTGENDKYKTYEMKADDIRLHECFQHPLYTFEYPEFFNLVDLNPNFIYSIPNLRGQLMGGPPMDDDMSIVDFTCKQEYYGRSSLLVIIVTQDYVDMFETNDLFKIYLSEHTQFTEEITIKEMLVSGISADYMESFQTLGKTKPQGNVEVYRMSARVVVFDYADLIWAIQLFWFYHEPEPPEIEEYFNHVIETFKILE